MALQSAIYADYFEKYYDPVEKDLTLCEGRTDEFRAPDGKNGKCAWPTLHTTTNASFVTHYCETDPKLKCLPYLYFIVNDLYGWLPQKTSATDNASCSLGT